MLKKTGFNILQYTYIKLDWMVIFKANTLRTSLKNFFKK